MKTQFFILSRDFSAKKVSGLTNWNGRASSTRDSAEYRFTRASTLVQKNYLFYFIFQFIIFFFFFFTIRSIWYLDLVLRYTIEVKTNVVQKYLIFPRFSRVLLSDIRDLIATYHILLLFTIRLQLLDHLKNKRLPKITSTTYYQPSPLRYLRPPTRIILSPSSRTTPPWNCDRARNEGTPGDVIVWKSFYINTGL